MNRFMKNLSMLFIFGVAFTLAIQFKKVGKTSSEVAESTTDFSDVVEDASGSHDSVSSMTASSAPTHASAGAVVTRTVPAAPRSNLVSGRTLTRDEEETWRKRLPTQEKVRAEVRRDPHGTPQSLQKMAPLFGDMMEEAKKSPLSRAKHFRKFELCAEDRDMSYVTSLKAICYMNAATIAELDPASFKRDAELLREKLDTSTRRLIESLQLN